MGGKALLGKTALVTGASQSIGLASASLLAQDGATIVVMGRGAGGLERARDALRESAPGSRVEAFVGDACDEGQIKAALKYAKGISGTLDILIPIVGGGIMQPILMRDVESVRREIEVNYISVFLMVRHGVPLLEHGGTIVCVSTVAVSQPFFGLGLYGAAKSAMERLVRAAALELGQTRIRINAVRPGMTVERKVLDDPHQAANYQDMATETPLGRVGTPEDIASTIRFLAGSESGWITGQCFSVDGGQDQGRLPDMMDVTFGKPVMDRIRAGQPIEPGTDIPAMASASLLPSRN